MVVDQKSEEDPRLTAIKKCIKSYPNFPSEGIIFRDFFPIFADPEVLTHLVSLLVSHVRSLPKVDVIIGLESRGFMLGPLMAYELKLPFVPIRKKGKLPGQVKSLSYEKEYGSDTFEIQTELVAPGSNYILVDDLLATGGSLKTSAQLIQSLGANVVEAIVLIELQDLKGRQHLSPIPVFSVVVY